MYVPAHFAQTDLAALHDAIERYSFATLISTDAGQLSASHLPLVLDREDAPQGTLLGHFARANRQWQAADGQEVLAIFSGPHAYISPQWYGATEVVPTWNYVAVHTYGRIELITDPRDAEVLLRRMVATYEATEPTPWELAESPDYVQRMLRQIVAFRIRISRLEGKWKLNQNRPEQQRANVALVLSQRSDESSREISRLMRVT